MPISNSAAVVTLPAESDAPRGCRDHDHDKRDEAAAVEGAYRGDHHHSEQQDGQHHHYHQRGRAVDLHTVSLGPRCRGHRSSAERSSPRPRTWLATCRSALWWWRIIKPPAAVDSRIDGRRRRARRCSSLSCSPPIPSSALPRVWLRPALERWTSAPAAEVVARWRELSDTIGKKVRIEIGDRVIEGTARDIDATGRLVVGGEHVSAGSLTVLGG